MPVSLGVGGIHSVGAAAGGGVSTGAGIGVSTAIGGGEGAGLRLGAAFFLGFAFFFFIIRFAFFFAPFKVLRFLGKQITRPYCRSLSGNKSSQEIGDAITVSRQCISCRDLSM